LCRFIINKFRAGVQLPRFFEDFSDDISLAGLDPKMAGIKIEENLEQLLTPTTLSISFKLTMAPGSVAKKQKPVVVKTLTTFVSHTFIFYLKSLTFNL
jgi:hypothetical protein